ncbi:MAG TPA: hypothetical protein VGC18_00390 [Lacisediminihabitans sp.]|uniref:hypothetical protein n=1 Tax=Lacisediminihabitans sp. TaxID=2787631 RepID=UPI002ED99C73
MDAGAVGALIPVVAIAGGITYAILNSYWKSKRYSGPSAELAGALEASTAANRAVAERLENIEARLGVVEKTLTDIP